MSCLHQDIIQNLNTRFVLYKRAEDDYSIVDKLKRVIIAIDDPIIDYHKLIDTLLKMQIEVYADYKDLPEAVEKPIKLSDDVKTMKVFVKKIYDQNQRETGSIISAMTDKLVTKHSEKRRIERLLEDYAFSVLYPYEGLNLYSDINIDTVSITVIRNINNLPYKDIDPSEAQIIDI